MGTLWDATAPRQNSIHQAVKRANRSIPLAHVLIIDAVTERVKHPESGAEFSGVAT
jgi:hypothetical protein